MQNRKMLCDWGIEKKRVQEIILQHCHFHLSEYKRLNERRLTIMCHAEENDKQRGRDAWSFWDNVEKNSSKKGFGRL